MNKKFSINFMYSEKEANERNRYHSVLILNTTFIDYPKHFRHMTHLRDIF